MGPCPGDVLEPIVLQFLFPVAKVPLDPSPPPPALRVCGAVANVMQCGTAAVIRCPCVTRLTTDSVLSLLTVGTCWSGLSRRARAALRSAGIRDWRDVRVAHQIEMKLALSV